MYAAHNWHTSHSKNAVFLGKTTDAQSVRPFRTTARHLAVLQATSSRRDKPWKSRLLMRVHRSKASGNMFRPLSKNQSRRIRGETSRITVTAGHFGSFVSPRVSAYHGSRLRELRIRSQAERNFGCSTHDLIAPTLSGGPWRSLRSGGPRMRINTSRRAMHPPC